MSLSESIARWRMKRAFKAARVGFLQDLGEVLCAGGGKLQSKLERLSVRNAGKPLGQAYAEIHRVLVRGGTIARAVEPFFSMKEHQMIDAYDSGAKDDTERGQGFLLVAKIIEPLEEIRGKAAMLLLRTVFSLAVIAIMWVGVGGGIAKDLEQLSPRSKWPALSRALVGSGEWLLSHWFIGVPIAAVLIGGLIWSFPNWTGVSRRWADRKLPGYVMFREYRSTISLVSLAAYLRSKKGLAYSFKKLGTNASAWELNYLNEISGRSARLGGTAMLDVGFFSERMIDRLALREDSMSLEQSLEEIGLKQADAVIETLKERLQISGAAVDALTKVGAALVFVAIVLIVVATTQSMQGMK